MSYLRFIKIWLIIINNIGYLWFKRLINKSSVKKTNLINQQLAKKIVKLLEELGPIFIKLGQTLSTRADLVGQEIAAELTKLQDRLSPFNFSLAKQILEQELAAPIAEHFSYFSADSIAAASIAQVHQAITVEGDKVAVKIRRPDVEERFARDLKLLAYLAELIDKFLPKLKRLKLKDVVNDFTKGVKIELDFRLEAAAMSEFAGNFKNDSTIYIPKVYWQYTNERILTTEWINGISINKRQLLVDKGYNLEKIATNLALVFFNQAYRDGFFHADQHAGNILINQQQQLVFIDFGITGRLPYQDRIHVAEILYGFLQRDYLKVAKIHFDANYVDNSKSIELFAQACRSIGEPIIGLPTNQISIAKLLAQLFTITEEFEMQVQPQLLLLQKTMMMVEGINLSLYPGVNMWNLVEPWIEKWAIKNISFEAKLLYTIKQKVTQLIDFSPKKIALDLKDNQIIVQLPLNYFKILLIILTTSCFITLFNKWLN